MANINETGECKGLCGECDEQLCPNRLCPESKVIGTEYAFTAWVARDNARTTFALEGLVVDKVKLIKRHAKVMYGFKYNEYAVYGHERQKAWLWRLPKKAEA